MYIMFTNIQRHESMRDCYADAGCERKANLTCPMLTEYQLWLKVKWRKEKI
jgi:hypothetical protein